MHKWTKNINNSVSTTVRPPPLSKDLTRTRKLSYLTTMDAGKTETNHSQSHRSKYTSSSKLTKSALFRTISTTNIQTNKEKIKK